MKNLAGVDNCDDAIIEELKAAGIDIVRHDRRLESEVPASITGELAGGTYRFHRAWYYWVTAGDVSLSIARLMYANQSRRDVRVEGHCMSPAPDEWAKPSIKELKRICEDESRAGDGGGSLFESIKDYRHIEQYHIDTQDGLNFFVATLKEHDGRLRRYYPVAIPAK